MAKKSMASAVPAIDKNWQAEDDLRTLVRACEIRKDGKRHAAAKALAKQQLAELKKISTATAEKG